MLGSDHSLAGAKASESFGYNPPRFTFIEPAALGTDIRSSFTKPTRNEVCDSKLEFCLDCGGKVRHVTSRQRLVEYLYERVWYEVHYYYCDHCKTSWPSIPPGALPNIGTGLDVFGMIAYMHSLRGKSYKVISEDLKDYFQMKRDPTTIGDYFNRFSLFTDEAQQVVDQWVQMYLEQQEESQGMFDETFFKGLASEKLCMGVFLIPEVRVIAGVRVTEVHNHAYLNEFFTEVRERLGGVETVAVDLAPGYPAVLEKVFGAVSIQFCVFHFFQILFRRVVHPLARTLRRKVKEVIKEAKDRVKVLSKTIERRLTGEDLKVAQELLKRLQWCLNRGWVYYLVAEVGSFNRELTRILRRSEVRQNSPPHSQNQSQTFQSFVKAVQKLTTSLLTTIQSCPDLKQFEEVYNVVQELKQLFRSETEEEFQQREGKLAQLWDETSNSSVNELKQLFGKYKANLTPYLQKGLEKTTSLLEQVNQRLKKNTSHHRGGVNQTTLQLFADVYAFFANTTPVRLRGETTADERSPMQRVVEAVTQHDSTNVDHPWWSWVPPLQYHRYRSRVKQLKQRLREGRSRRKQKNNANDGKKCLPYTDKARQRWEGSKTLQTLEKRLCQPLQTSHNQPSSSSPPEQLFPHDLAIYGELQQYPLGVAKTEFYKTTRYSKRTLSDSLARLIRLGYVQECKGRPPNRKRALQMFLPLNPPG